MTRQQIERWRELGQQLRVDSVRSSSAAGSGHPTSSMSAADLMAVLIDRHLCYDFASPDDPRNDHLIFSKGHASPLLYAMFRAVGAIDDEEMLSFRKRGSRMEGHPTPRLPWVDVATGSLGQGLPIGVGVALAGKRLDRLPYRVWVLCGDSEMAEGSMWEAVEHASHAQLDNLIAILDVNRLGQSGETMHGWNLDDYARRLNAAGWHTIELDGHDVMAIDMALTEATQTSGRPTALIAKTEKGRGVAAVANRDGRHGKPLDDPEAAIRELGGRRDIRIDVAKPSTAGEPHAFPTDGRVVLPRYEVGKKEATRKAYGEALSAVGSARGDVVALDGEVSNSTYSEIFRDAHPERYFEMYIAEQQLAAAAVGMQVRGWRPFASTFAAFWSRAYDFIRMAAISRADVSFVGSHAGVSIGEDGPSQMALEDLAMMRAVYGSTVLYPADGNSTANLVAQTADMDGVTYMRTTRENTEKLYDAGEAFPIGGSKTLRSSENDRVTLVGAGVTIYESLKAADELAQAGITARVIDAYSVKPIDTATLRKAMDDTGLIVVTEDHWLEGGLGDAVLGALAEAGPLSGRVIKIGVTAMPGSGKPAELREWAGISASKIAAKVREALNA